MKNGSYDLYACHPFVTIFLNAIVGFLCRYYHRQDHGGERQELTRGPVPAARHSSILFLAMLSENTCGAQLLMMCLVAIGPLE